MISAASLLCTIVPKGEWKTATGEVPRIGTKFCFPNVVAQAYFAKINNFFICYFISFTQKQNIPFYVFFKYQMPV